MDPGTVAPTTLITAGSNGAVVTSVIIHAEATQTADKHVLWIQLLGSGSWYPVKSVLMPAYTQAATTAQASVTVVDKANPTANTAEPRATLNVTRGLPLASEGCASDMSCV